MISQQTVRHILEMWIHRRADVRFQPEAKLHDFLFTLLGSSGYSQSYLCSMPNRKYPQIPFHSTLLIRNFLQQRYLHHLPTPQNGWRSQSCSPHREGINLPQPKIIPSDDDKNLQSPCSRRDQSKLQLRNIELVIVLKLYQRLQQQLDHQLDAIYWQQYPKWHHKILHTHTALPHNHWTI